MRWIPASILICSIAALATVPYSFPAGVPAKASQVNRNFEAIDSLVTAQIEMLAQLRENLVAKTDSLRKDVDALRANPVAAAPTVAAVQTPDTSWKALALPVGSVLGLTTAPGADGYLPGSNKTWQLAESFGGINGLPSLSPLPVPAAVATAPADSQSPAVVAGNSDSSVVAATVKPAVAVVAATAETTITKPTFRWYVKVK